MTQQKHDEDQAVEAIRDLGDGLPRHAKISERRLAEEKLLRRFSKKRN
ncbi:hypothetical protein [Sphingomonas koreensis]|jgi:hypothetical protein|nr:hypothetical protein [Sphingomonas koreensis]